MLPAAPGLFSTTIGCFQRWLNQSCMMRGKMSVEPPAGYGTTIFTGFQG